MMGDDLIVAPIVTGTSRTVLIPKGSWTSDDVSVIEGPVNITIDVPLARLPFFERQPSQGKQ